MTVATRSIYLRFVRRRGEVWVDVAPQHVPRDQRDWKDIETVLIALDQPNDIHRPTNRSLVDAYPLLRHRLDDLRRATSEGQWALIKQRLRSAGM